MLGEAVSLSESPVRIAGLAAAVSKELTLLFT